MNSHSQRQLHIVWIPGHYTIEGNECADTEAKRAALDPTISPPFAYQPLKSCRIQHIKAMAKIQWNKEWNENTKTGKHLRRIAKRNDVNQGLKLYSNIEGRQICTTITQLRTGHCGLNSYLYRFRKSASPYCKCGYGKETVEHFLLECVQYRKQRKVLRRNVRWNNMKIKKLLGDIKLIKHTVEYVRATKRLDT